MASKSYPLGPVKVDPLGTGETVRWRVLTCMNRTTNGCVTQESKGLSGKQFVRLWGPVTVFPGLTSDSIKPGDKIYVPTKAK